MSKSQTFTAGCSAVGGFSYAGNFTLYVVLTDRDGNSGTNVSQVDYNVYCQSNGSGSISAKHLKYFSINGSEKINTTETVNVSSPYAYISIASGTISVTHNNDGSATIPFSAQIKASSYGVSASVSGNFELEKIARYTTVTNSARGRSINTISVNWTTTDARDHTQYSLNGGTWTDAGDTVASDNKSGYYTVSGLNSNTSYTIKTRCKRADSQLWSEASTLTITTYDIARITAAPNVNIGSSHTITWTNPGGATTSLKLCKTDGTQVISYGTVTGTSKTVTPTASTIYALTPNSNTLTLQYILTTTQNGKSYTNSKNCVFSVTNSNPTFSNFTYQDTDSTTLALTGNNQTIVKGYSNVKGIVSVANKATAKNSATMSKYRLAIGEKTAEVSYSSSAEVSTTISDVTSNSFTMYAIDSRGNSTGKTITASTYINYTPITITSISVVRTNSVTSETTLKFSGNIWNGSFGSVTNSIKSCSYKYKLSSASSWTTGTTTITPTKSGSTFSFTGVIAGDLGADGFNINNSYNIQVLIADQLSNNNSNPATFTLGPGTPAVAIYKNNVAIGQKYDTSDGSKLQVNGKTALKDVSNMTKSSGDTGYYAKRSDTGVSVWFGVGSGGTNHGIYSQKLNKWLVYSDGTNVFLGNSSKTFQINDASTRGVKSATSKTHTGYGTNNGYLTDVSMLSYWNGAYNSSNSSNLTYCSDGTIQAKPTSLYDNSSGTSGTVTLSSSSANFTYLEIFYKDGWATVTSCRVYSPNGKAVQLLMSRITDTTNLMDARLDISTSTMTRLSDYDKSWQSWNNSIETSTEIKIYKVIGYK